MANGEGASEAIAFEAALSIFMLFLMAKDNPAHNNGYMFLALLLGISALFQLGFSSGKIATSKEQKTGSLYLHFLLAYCVLIVWLWLS